MAITDFEAMYGFVLPAASYDDSASPHSDNEDENTMNASDPDALSQSLGAGEVNTGEKRKSRRPPSTAERRATHNAVERARRESLNGRFMELASALPTMASVKRPSKSVIVAKSLEYVYATEDRERALREENAALRKEVDELRAKLGLPASTNSSQTAQRRASPIISEMPRERVGSFDDSASSLFSGSPSTSGTSFAESPLTNVQGLSAVSPGYSAVFNRSMIQEPAPTPKPEVPAQQTNLMAASQTMPIPVTGMPLYMGIPAMSPYESNYLMALSMQQQQAAVQHQNALNLAMGNGNAVANGGMPNWSGYNFGMQGMNHPISSGVPDYSSNLVFG